MKFSVVIAACNEGVQIAQSLKRLRQISPSPMEIILVDGGSDDRPAAIAREWADQIIEHASPNRGAQLDAGARKASGDLLFFLRPDAQPPGNWQQVLEHFWLANHPKKMAATVFSVDYGAGFTFRLAARLSNARVRVRQVAGGDHGLCTTPEIYRDCGGFPHFAYMEDAVFCQRLRARGEIALLKETVWPAARRMHRSGPLAWGLKHLWLSLRFKLGASPDDLWRSYAGL